MIEVYVFLAMFPVQILGCQCCTRSWFTRHIRTGRRTFPPNALRSCIRESTSVELMSAFSLDIARLNTVIAVLGLLLLGWFISYMQRPDWDEGRGGRHGYRVLSAAVFSDRL